MKTLHKLTALSLCAMMGPIHRSAMRFDKDVLTEAEFQQRVLKETESTTKKLNEVTEKYDRLDKETKTAYEDFTKKLKDASTKAEELERANKKLNLQMARERSNNLSNPIQRITHDPEKCARMAAIICLSASRGEIRNLAPKILAEAGIEAKALGEDSGFGSDLITPDLARDIYDSLPIYGAWSVLGYRSLGTKVTELPVKTARAQANFIVNEGDAIAEDATKDGTSVPATVRPIGTLLSVSRQLLDDSPLDVVADVMNDFIEGNAQCMDYAAFVANGTADNTNGGFTGIFVGGTAKVATTTHTSFGALTYDDVLSTLLAVDQVVLQRAARWFMHPFALVKLMGIKDGQGRPIFQTIMERPAPNAVGSILGYPVTLVNNAPFTDGTSKPLLAFGDPQSGVMGIRKDFAFEYSDDYKFNTYQRTFRGISRMAFAIRKATAFAVLKTAAS